MNFTKTHSYGNDFIIIQTEQELASQEYNVSCIWKVNDQ